MGKHVARMTVASINKENNAMRYATLHVVEREAVAKHADYHLCEGGLHVSTATCECFGDVR